MTTKPTYPRTSIVQVCSFICIIFTLSSCDKSQVISEGSYYMTAATDSVIADVSNNGIVTTSRWRQGMGQFSPILAKYSEDAGNRLVLYPNLKFELEGPAKLGDHFRYKIYYTEILRETGVLEKVAKKVTVESDHIEDYRKSIIANGGVPRPALIEP